MDTKMKTSTETERRKNIQKEEIKFQGENNEMPNEEDKKEDDEMDNVNDKLDKQPFNEDNEISSEEGDGDKEDAKKPPVDLN
jgi:hypothetical protein